jgi:D-inositol-3-phosphate glycosyltransferase
VIPPGIDTADFPLVDLGEAKTRATEWGWSILYVGRIDPVKGVETLLRAVAESDPAATLTLMGGGSAEYTAHIQRLAQQLGIADRVSFDRCSRSELRLRYQAADVVVFPSEWDEPFGLVPLEAMACGTPVIATGTGGAAEFLVDGENCRRFRAGDAVGLRQALEDVAGDPRLRATLINGGLRTAGEITIDRYADGLLALHEAALLTGSR